MALQEVKLPSGNTVTLKDPTSLRVKDRKRIIKASDSAQGELGKAIALGEELIAILVDSWSFDLLPPSVKIESLDELEIADYDALIEASGDISKLLFPGLAKTTENEADPKVTTENSNA